MFRFEDPIYLYLLAVIPLLMVIRFLMAYIRKHNFIVFGYYRIVLGLLVLGYFRLLN